MNTFGLGLTITFDDQASEGIARVTQSYLGLESAINSSSGGQLGDALASQVGLNLSQIGDSLIGVGSKVTSVFKNLVGNVKNTGQEFENFKITLGAVYKDESIVDKKLQQLFDFSIKSPFEVTDTKDMLLVLKSIGVDAFDTLTSASTGFAQEGLSWITDLMSFKPDVPVTRWKLALTNFLGSGEAKVLRNILDSGDISDIIGRDIADTAEGRMQDLMDVATNLGVEGLTDAMSGTLETKLSNIGDFFTKFYYKIADAGAFEQVKRMISNMSEFLTNDELMNEDRINGLASSINEALTFILTPVERLTEKFKELSVAAVDFASKHPNILKLGLVFVTLTGGAITLLGVLAKLGGATTSFLASLKYLSGGMSIFSMFRTGIWSIFKLFGPLSAAAFLLYKVWEANIGGIQEIVTSKVKSIVDTVTLIWDAFKDYELSPENFEKARVMGILPLIESILQLKYHWGFFVDGFKKGLDDFVKGIGNVLVKLGILDVNFTGFRDLLTKIFESMTKPGMTETWERIGEAVGNASGKLLLIVSSLGLIHKAFKVLGGVSSGLSSLSRLPLIGGLFGGKDNKGVGGMSSSVLAHPITVLKELTSATLIVGGVIGLIEVLGVLEKTPGFNKYLSSGLSVMSTLFKNLASIVVDIVALSLAIKLLDLIKLSPGKSLKGIADLAIILVGFTAIVGIVGALANIPMVSYFITSGAKTLSNLFTAMEVFTTPEFWGAIIAISALGFINPATVALGIAGLAIIIAGVGLIVAAFGALSMIDGFDEFMKSGGKSLANLFEIIGEICGSFVSGIAVGLTNGLPDIADNISKFAENLKPFFSIVKDAPVEEIGKFLISFGEFMLMMSAEELLSFITGGIDLPTIGSELSLFATNAKTFFDTVAEYSENGMNNAAKVFDVLSGMGNSAFKIGGIAAVISGETNLAVIGLELSSFAPNAKTFFDTVAQYPEEGINKAPRVFEALGGMGDSAFKIGGLSAVISGETALNVIGYELSSFAPNAKIFFDTVAQYPDDGIAKAPIVFEALAGMGNSAFKIGGMAAIISGETALSIIGYELASFAPNGATFFNAVAGYSDEGIEKTPDVFKCLEGMGDSAFKIGGIAALISGETRLDLIGEQLSSFGPSMKGYIDSIKDFSDSDLDKAEKVLNFLSVIGDSGLKSGGIKSLINGGLDLEDLGEQLTDYAEELEDFFDIVGFFNDDDINNGMRCIEMLTALGEADIREGGVLGAIRGGFNLSDLGSQLSKFGPGVKSFFDSVKDLDDGSFERGSRAIQTLTVLNDATFKDGGLLQAINGSVDIGNIARNLGDFGTNSKTFFTSVRDLKYEDFAKATKLFEALGTIDSFSDVVISLGPNTLSSFGKELVSFVEDLATFLEKSSGFDTSGFTLTESLEPFFKAIDAFDSNQLLDISSGLDNVAKSSSDFSIVLETVSIEVKENSKSILTAIEDCVTNSLTALNNFSSQGENIGYNLMVSLANGITANAYMITNAVQSAVDSVNVSIPNIASNTASKVYGPQKMVGLATGGYVNTTGVAVLHPNEVVVNDHITQELKSFLSDYKSGNTLKRQSVINQTIVTNSTQESYSNQFNSSMDDSSIVGTLMTLNSTLGDINSNIKENTLNTLGLNVPSTSVVNNYPTSVINNDVVNENGTKFDDSNVVRSLLNLNSTLNTLGLNSKPTSIINNNTVNENTTKLDEVKTVEVLTGVLNTLTEKSNSIVGLIKNSGSVRYDTGDYYNTKLALTIKGLVESIGDYGKRHYDNSPLIRQDIVADDSYSERPEIVTIETTPPEDNIDKDRPVENGPMQTLVENNNVLNNNNRVENNRSDSNSSTDNRVIFNSGSITIKVDSNGGKISEEELNNCADKLMKIIGRKMQLRGMQTRK